MKSAQQQSIDSRLGQLVGWYHPVEWALAVADYSRIADTPRHPAHVAPFERLRIIEANCAYHSPLCVAAPTDWAIEFAVGVLRESANGYEQSLIQREFGLDLFMQVQHRKQLICQFSGIKRAMVFGRFSCLYIHNNDLAPLCNEVYHTFGIDFLHWFIYCTCSYADSKRRGLGRVSAKFIEQNADGQLPKQSHQMFAVMSSLTPSEIGDYYHESRAKLRNQEMSICLESAFLSFPMMNFGDGRLLAPLPDLIIRHLIDGLNGIMKASFPELYRDIYSHAFENYIYRLCVGTFSEKHVNRPDRDFTHDGKLCDLMVDLGESVLLIECKATSVSRVLITPDTIRKDTSTRHLEKACKQIASTAECLRAQGMKKPIYAFVLPDCDLFGANRPWFWDMALDLKPDVKHALQQQMAVRPQILSTEAFEMLIAYLRYSKASVPEMLEQAARMSTDITSPDWEIWLGQLLEDAGISDLAEHEDAIKATADRLAR